MFKKGEKLSPSTKSSLKSLFTRSRLRKLFFVPYKNIVPTFDLQNVVHIFLKCRTCTTKLSIKFLTPRLTVVVIILRSDWSPGKTTVIVFYRLGSAQRRPGGKAYNFYPRISCGIVKMIEICAIFSKRADPSSTWGRVWNWRFWRAVSFFSTSSRPSDVESCRQNG